MKWRSVIVFLVLATIGCKEEEEPLPPVIQSFTPLTAKVGESVTISGQNFSATKTDNVVKFNNTVATLLSATASELVAVVPANATSGNISVTIGSQTATSTIVFAVLQPPSITGFNPASGAGGTSVVIGGSNFVALTGECVVKFNGVKATTSNVIPGSITAVVPETATTGKITIEVNGFTTESTAEFSVQHTLTGFSPASGSPGTVVTITGKNFSSTASQNIVKFNNVTATVLEASAFQLKAEAPDGSSGKISVEIGSVKATSATDYFYPPVITSIGPPEGIYGTLVGVNGKNFVAGAANNTVKLNNLAVTVSTATTTQILFTLPMGATSGKISVTSNGLTAESSESFIVSPWGPLQSLSVPRLDPKGFVIGSRIYVIGGLGDAGRLKDVWEYDTQANTWAEKAEFPGTVRSSPVAFSIGSYGYYGTGVDPTGAEWNDLWRFDPQTNSWQQMADLPGTPRYGAAAFTIDGYGYVGTGYGGPPNVNSFTDFYRYDPANNSWLAISNFAGGPRSYMNGFVVGGKAYFGSGSNASEYYNDFWEYSPATNNWTQRAGLPAAGRNYSSAFAVGNMGYFGLGHMNNERFSDLWAYHPATNTWTRKKDHWNGDYTEALGVSVGAKGYVLCGLRGSTNTGDVWEYDPEKDPE